MKLVFTLLLLLTFPVALPPPPAMDEEAPANYFNLDPSTSSAVMNITLPPPPGINPPPPGKIIIHGTCANNF